MWELQCWRLIALHACLMVAPLNGALAIAIHAIIDMSQNADKKRTNSMKRKIGFIGLGVLGSAIVPNLIGDDFDVVGYDIHHKNIKKLEPLGMQPANSPCEAAMLSDVLITCLPTVNSLLEVYGGKTGIDKAQKSGQIIIETSTFPVEDKEKVKIIMNIFAINIKSLII